MKSGIERPTDEERRAFALRELARAAEDPAQTAATLARARVHFVETLAGRDAARTSGSAGSPWFALLLGFAAAVAMVSVALLVRRAQHGAELRGGAVTYAVEGVPGAVGAWHSAPAASPLSLRFSEGTNLLLSAKASLRVVQTDEHGATVALERGRVHARVEHRDGTRWAVEAGPYHVRVTGTEFDVEWDPAAGAFGIQLSAGSVQVTGCNAAGARVARGESLKLHCESNQPGVEPTRRHDATDGDPHPPVERAAEAHADAEAAPARATPAMSSTELPEATEPSRSRATPSSTNNHAEVATPAAAPAKAAASAATDEHPADEKSPEAEPQHGDPAPAAAPSTAADQHAVCEQDAVRGRAALAAALESGTADTAWAAIQCARRAGLSSDSEDALRVFRDRYGADSRRATAAFLLGKLAFARGAFTTAARWFEASRREAPGGQLARESAGRLIEAWQRAGDTGAAIRAAREYLAAYPEGPHARLARSLLAP